MGVLDDAIREHLDLKRRHGAAEEELRRQEEEALGPARREVAPEEAEEDGAAAAEAEAAPELPADEVQEEALPLDQPTEPHAVIEEAPAHDEALPTSDTPAAGFEELADDELLDEEEPEDELLPREELAHEHGEPAHDEHGEPAHDEHGEPAHEGHGELADTELADGGPADAELDDEELEGDDRDLLEDTPDFLEETPEHDRLWFEQKPPRDFDFD
jgi:hypothetical protein